MTTPSAAAPAPQPHPRSHAGPQAGILNRPPEHLLLFALEFLGDPRSVVQTLRACVQGELTSDLPPAGSGGDPAVETGELGFADHYDRAHLTITVGFSASGYSKLGVTGDERPQDLVDIPWPALGDSPVNPASGDVIVQVCADSAYITEHVLRRIEHQLAGQARVVWAHTGVQRYSSRAGRTAKREGRAWIGFLDGTSNLDPKNSTDDYALTFVNPDHVSGYPPLPELAAPAGYGPGNQPQFPGDLRPPPAREPESTRHGTYLAVRISAHDLATWDGRAVADQEHDIGRRKLDGVALDLTGQPEATADTPPMFATDPSNEAVAVDAHIRKANPRTAADLARRIFRRGYPLYEGADGGLRRGLIFVAYGRTLSTQFEFITRGWLTNPNFPRPGAGVDRLRSLDTAVLAGGYYFVPPLDDVRQPWSWHLPA